MRLKWPPVRLRRRRAGPGSTRLLPRRWSGCPSSGSALLRAAGQRQLLPAQEVVWGRWLRVRAESLQPGVSALREATEESSARVLRARSAGCPPPAGGRLGRRRPALRPRGSLLAVSPRRCLGCRAGGRSHLALRSLASEWPHPTRLETRTKECNMCASPGVANPSA